MEQGQSPVISDSPLGFCKNLLRCRVRLKVVNHAVNS